MRKTLLFALITCVTLVTACQNTPDPSGEATKTSKPEGNGDHGKSESAASNNAEGNNRSNTSHTASKESSDGNKGNDSTPIPVNGNDQHETKDPDSTDEPEVKIIYKDRIVYQDREVKVEVPVLPKPLNMPEVGSEPFKELTASASFKTILKMLEDKVRMEGDALPVEQQMALVTTYLSLNVGNKVENDKYLDAAYDLYQELKDRTDVDPQWKLHVSSLIKLQTGEEDDARVAAQELRNAYLIALRSVPLQIHNFYHSLSIPDKEKKFYQKRLLKNEKRENKVYRPGDTMMISVIFSYLHGIYDSTKEKWHYVCVSDASLFERDEANAHNLGIRVREFRTKTLREPFWSKYEPDQANVNLLEYPLPADIKANKDYVLVITLKDGKRESQEEKIFVDVKVRTQLPD